MSVQIPIVDEYGAFGPYGGDPLAQSGSSFAERFPYQLADFRVEAALDGPQAVATWERPARTIARLKIVRKLLEYPRDPDDGVVVLDSQDQELTQLVDIGDDLLDSEDLGALRWWYYRAFSLPDHPELALQLSNLAVQEIDGGQDGEPLDVQTFEAFTIYGENLDNALATLDIETAPTEDGPWVFIQELQVAVDETAVLEIEQSSYKWIRVYADQDVLVSISVRRETAWQTSLACSRPCLVYRSGLHLDAIWRRHLIPEAWRSPDELTERQDRIRMAEAEGLDGHLANQNEPSTLRGPLYRFLKVVSLEFDRVRAYVDALRAFVPDIDVAPDFVLAHIANAMGWRVDTSRPLLEVREELLRQPQVWKAKGSARLIEVVAAQILGIVPRIQEGSGLVYYLANPDNFSIPEATLHIGGAED